MGTPNGEGLAADRDRRHTGGSANSQSSCRRAFSGPRSRLQSALRLNFSAMTPSPSSAVRRPGSGRGSGTRRWLRRLAGLVLLAVVGWFGWLYLRINAVAVQDEARPADAIAVFGAAEYSGRPSPVLHARLDHAVELYREEIAPLVITLRSEEHTSE